LFVKYGHKIKPEYRIYMIYNWLQAWELIKKYAIRQIFSPERDETLMREYLRTILPECFNPEKGMKMVLKDKMGKTIPARITKFNEKSITIDLNHPLAGENLTFDFKVVGVEYLEKEKKLILE
jgi:hypothetical protein